MGKIVISEFVTLDGVIEDPAGGEGFSRGGWVGHISAREEVDQVKLDEALAAEALLLGRRTYEFFAARWPSRTGALADRLNALPKYVVSSTLERPAWNNASLLTGDVVGAVSQLGRDVDGEVVVYGSFRLVRTLLEHDLVDELRLLVYPVLLGSGERLFAGSADQKPTRLTAVRAVADSVALLSYEVIRTG
jgi:dihydrofolate reductase